MKLASVTRLPSFKDAARRPSRVYFEEGSEKKVEKSTWWAQKRSGTWKKLSGAAKPPEEIGEEPTAVIIRRRAAGNCCKFSAEAQFCGPRPHNHDTQRRIPLQTPGAGEGQEKNGTSPRKCKKTSEHPEVSGSFREYLLHAWRSGRLFLGPKLGLPHNEERQAPWAPLPFRDNFFASSSAPQDNKCLAHSIKRQKVSYTLYVVPKSVFHRGHKVRPGQN